MIPRMYTPITILLLLFTIAFPVAGQVRIDHVVYVVTDLEKSIIDYTNQGFTVLAGRLHANGLHNAHIKFNDGSALELMTLVGKPKDELAKEYQALLNKGEGGVFIALTGIPFTELQSKLQRAGINFSIQKGKSWDYLIFQDITSLDNFFFIEYKNQFQKQTHSHPNGGIKIEQVWTEGDSITMHFLNQIGFVHNTNPKNGSIDEYEEVGTGGQSIIVHTKMGKGTRPRIIKTIIATDDGKQIQL